MGSRCKYLAYVFIYILPWLTYRSQGALDERKNVMKLARIEQPCTILCPLDITKMLHIAWYRCTKDDLCRKDWDKHRIAHIEDMAKVHDDYPGRFGVELNGTLTIKKVLPEDDGMRYICRGMIQHSGMVENTTIVKITREPPEISNMSPLEIIVIEGMPSLLECKALGYPYPNISWSYNQVVLLNGTRELILIRRNATKSFSGEYTCRAENPLGNMSITRKLTVVDKPNEQMDSNGRWKTAFWALLVIVLLVLVVIVVAVVIKKIWRRHDQAILPVKGNGVANGNAVDDANSSAVTVANGDAVVNNGNNVELDVEDGKRDENNFKNDGLDDGYVGDNIVQNGNWVWTTSC